MPGDKQAVVIFQPNVEQLLVQAKQSPSPSPWKVCSQRLRSWNQVDILKFRSFNRRLPCSLVVGPTCRTHALHEQQTRACQTPQNVFVGCRKELGTLAELAKRKQIVKELYRDYNFASENLKWTCDRACSCYAHVYFSIIWSACSLEVFNLWLNLD